ncbi:MAG: DUF1929 domain-containing protein [Gemmatimonadales bacterium]|nr:DUF1929 domain-containing protein [Gemmatimonadales bacterium]
MLGTRLTGRTTWLLPAALLAACDPQSSPRTPPAESPPAPAGAEDAAIRLEYVCGNRFVIVNALPHSVTVAYEVRGSEERGERRLAPALAGDPPFTEVEFTVLNGEAVALYAGDSLLAVRENGGTPCEPIAGLPAVAAASAAAGQWSPSFSWPNVGVHLHLLRDGKVLSWGKTGDPYLWTPSTRATSVVPSPFWAFCAGHSHLPDGRLLVAAGHISDNHGLRDAATFTPSTRTWAKVPSMKYGRWYPTNTTLGNGHVLVIAGADQAGKNVQVPEVWTGRGWRALTGALRTLPYYPRTFLAPNGRIFYAGEQRATLYLTTSGSGSWSTVGLRKFAGRDYGSAVMYLPGKVLYAGGGRTTRTAEVIDLNRAAPAWQWTGSMAHPRRHLNATVLPTGEVLVTGGSSGTTFNEPSLAVRVAEIWDPETGVWTSLASNAVNRTYHATSLLLPDGRVLHAGSGDALQPTGEPAPPQRNAELFSPPYLFKGARPGISSTPSSIEYGRSFFVGTPTPTGIAKVSLVALGSVTHAFDMGQRFTWLGFTGANGGIDVSAPASPNGAPPGYYMLFLLNGSRVPSVGKIVRLR